jgi:hypothetical protein
LTEVQEVPQESDFTFELTVTHIVQKETCVLSLKLTVPLPEVTQVARGSGQFPEPRPDKTASFLQRSSDPGQRSFYWGQEAGPVQYETGQREKE